METLVSKLFVHFLLLLYLTARSESQDALKDSANTSALSKEEAEEAERRHTQNVVRLAATDQLNSEIITNRTRAYLSCESGEMIVKINFSEPFRGVAYSDYDRSSPCKFYGDGGRYYEMRLPLKGCGTKQEAPRLFINNIIVRFHRSLELEEDEIKTIICRYPPPLAPPPPHLPSPYLVPTPPPAVIVPAKLSEVELLLIICALLFLTLLLLGIGIAYYCLKRRNIKVIRKRKVPSTGPPSEITKISRSTFEPFRIPRATAVSTTSSEPPISSDSYPSESSSDERRSLVSDTSTIRHDHYKYENAAFIPEPYPPDIEREESVTSLPVPVIAKPNITKHDLLTTILETEHITEEDVFNTTHKRTTNKLYKKLPPVYAKIKRKPASIPDNDDRSASEVTEEVPKREPSLSSTAPSLYGSIPDNDDWAHSELDEGPDRIQYIRPPRYDVTNVDDYYITTKSETDIDEDITRHKRSVRPPPKITTQTIDEYYITKQPSTDITEDTTTKRITSYPKPRITTQTIDDYYQTQQPTTEITEDITTRRLTTYPKPKITTKTTDEYYLTQQPITEITDDTTTRRITSYPKPKVTTQTTDDYYVTKQPTSDITDDITTRRISSYPPPKITTADTGETYLGTESTTDITDDTTTRRKTTYPKPKLTRDTEDDYYVGTRETTDITDDTTTKRITKFPTPKITVHNIDDLFITNISETETTQLTTKNAKLPPPAGPPRILPPSGVSTKPIMPKPSAPESDIPSGRRFPVQPTKELPETRTTISEAWDKYTRDKYRESTTETSRLYIPPQRFPKYNVIISLLDNPPMIEGIDRLTPDVRYKFRTIITTDEVFRTQIIESTTIEEYIHISRDVRYERIFEPPIWRVFVRLLSLPEILTAPTTPDISDTEVKALPRYRKGDPRRRGSLPSISGEPVPYLPETIRSRRTSRSGSIFDSDVRSLTEEDVTFARRPFDRDSLWSQDTGYSAPTRYLDDVPITPSTRRPYTSRTTHISEYVVPPYRSYSPDISALNLAIGPSYTPRYMSSATLLRGRTSYERQTLDRSSSVGEREEIKSMTEKDVYDWLRH